MSEKKYDDIGTIFFCEEVGEHKVAKVREAATLAGFDENIVRDIRPRNAFIRAIQKLTKEGQIEAGANGVLRDKTVDDKQVLTFQFSQRFVEENKARYDPSAVVVFHKDSNTITSESETIAQLARDLFMDAGFVFSAQDINGMAKRLIERAGARKLFLRDGVYFIGRQHYPLVEKLKKFYSELDCDFYLLAVNAQANSSGEITRAVVKDVVREVQRLTAEVNQLRADDKLTPRIAKARLHDLQTALAQYNELAQSIKVDLGSIIHDAGDAGEVLQTVGTGSIDQIIAGMQTGRKINKLVFDLLETAEPEALAAVQRTHVAPVNIEVPDEESEVVA